MREETGSEKGTESSYYEIWNRLPRETRDYVPLMLAMGHIAKDPARYGFTELEYQEPLEYETVQVPGGTLGVRMWAAEDGEHVSLSGPAVLVFEGSLSL